MPARSLTASTRVMAGAIRIRGAMIERKIQRHRLALALNLKRHGIARKSARGDQVRKLDFPIGKLPPVLDDWQVTALRRLIDDFAGLQTGRINRQRENLSLRNAGHPVCQIPRTNEHVTPPWLMLASVPS